MNLTGEIKCPDVDCDGKIISTGGYFGKDIVNTGRCNKCNIRTIIYLPNDMFEYSLNRELKDKE